MISKKLNNIRFYLLILGVVAAMYLGWLLFVHIQASRGVQDPLLRKTFKNVDSVNSYAQTIETRTIVSNRTLEILGEYDIDKTNKAYLSFSTTTLFIGNDQTPHTFEHQNIAIKNTVYTRVDTVDPQLQTTIQRIPQWHTFLDTKIPSIYGSIVIPGPIEDTFSLFKDNGIYVTIQKNLGTTFFNTESLPTYSLTLSKKAFAAEDGQLSTLVSRIGHEGIVTIWIDPNTNTIKHMVFSNPPYYSTTTIRALNILPPIVPPEATQL